MPRTPTIVWLVIGFGVLNAILYAGLLPLWEGFDEPYHYGYVQDLSRRHVAPAMDRSFLSEEILQSMATIPVSGRVRENVRQGVSYEDYWRLGAEEQGAMRRRLNQIDPREGARPSKALNYEAHQAPLAYLVLAPLDWSLSAVALPHRVLALRIFCGVACVLLTAWAALRLAALLEVSGTWRLTALFLILASQMFYATAAHVANDWLAMPLFLALVGQCAAAHRDPTARHFALLGVVLAAGLLTKAHFLAMAPLACGIVVWALAKRRTGWRNALAFVIPAALAAPWYVRNLAVRGSLSGMQETAAPVPAAQLAAGALHLPWLRAIWTTAQMSLWTGNNSFTTFQSSTIAVLLLAALAAVAVCVWRLRYRGISAPERITLLAIASFIAALIYVTILTFWYTKGVGFAPLPSYTELVWPPLLIWMMLGLSYAGRTGAAVRIAMIWLWTYVIAATYVAKLVPYYAGLTRDRARLADLPSWWRQLAAGHSGLDAASLLPTVPVAVLTGAVAIAALWLAVRLSFPPAQNPQRA